MGTEHEIGKLFVETCPGRGPAARPLPGPGPRRTHAARGAPRTGPRDPRGACYFLSPAAHFFFLSLVTFWPRSLASSSPRIPALATAIPIQPCVFSL